MTAALVVIAGAQSNLIVINGDFNRLGGIPFLAYAAPLALFPLMAFFLWWNCALYRPFLNLYVAGKALGLVAVGVWAFRTKPWMNVFFFVRAGMGNDALLLLALPLVSCVDVLSIIAMLAVCGKGRAGGAPAAL